MRLAVLVAVFFGYGCGGGSSPSAALEPATFHVTAVTPLPSSDEVPLTQEINVIFSRPVDEDSLTVDSLEVVAETGDVIPGDRSVSRLTPSVVRFLPRGEYFPFAVHKIVVTQDVRDSGGSHLVAPYESEFRTQGEGPVLPVQSQLEDHGALLRVGRYFHRMTLLKNNRFLVTGGYTADGALALQSAENLIPTLGQSTLISAPMDEPRAGHVQVLLRDGRVLIAGGEPQVSPFTPLRGCEIFDPSPGVFTFTPAAPMHHGRSFAQAILLRDGRVLVTGGQGVNDNGAFILRNDAEIYDPATDTWTLLGSHMAKGRSTHFGALTPVGDVVLIGGTTGAPSATLFFAGSLTFSPQLGSPFAEHFFGAATLLRDGRPFVAGGTSTRGSTIWDPKFGFLGAVNAMTTDRAFATATAFQDGRVLIVGGMKLDAVPPLIHASVEVFYPIGSTGRFFPATKLSLPEPMTHHAAALGPEGKVWITGSLTGDGGASRRVIAIRPHED